MIWDFMDPVFAFRCIGSIVVILLALFVFRTINASISTHPAALERHLRQAPTRYSAPCLEHHSLHLRRGGVDRVDLLEDMALDQGAIGPRSCGKLTGSDGDTRVSLHPLRIYRRRSNVSLVALIRPAGGFCGWSSTIPGCSSARIQLEEMINRGEPTVYYCPLFPRLACLRPGGLASSIFLLVAAVICSIIARGD